MSTSQSEAERHLAAYSYFRAESEKEPTNYVIMRKCINHGAEISRYVDFDGFLSDKPELCDDIFADCERKNICISRYCEDKSNVEKSDYAMIWIYIHIKEYDNAKKLIERLPSLKSNNLREHIEAKLIRFQYGFEKEKEYINNDIEKLFDATAKEFFYTLEDYAWFAEPIEAVDFAQKILAVFDAYKAFGNIRNNVLETENTIRRHLTRCYAKQGEYEKAALQLRIIADNCAEIMADREPDEIKEYTLSAINKALSYISDCGIEKITDSNEYKDLINGIEHQV